ncbi:MAG: methyl-accepting chemotaxis protein, partial [Heliobacteriaceae bacterium]|nr:methyl-accepting chemotaxis protein [Heliobacteriaceae bacterium]
MKLTIGKKIGSGFGVMLIMLLVLGSSSFYFLNTIKDQFTTINEAHDRQELGLKILDEFGSGIAAIRGFVAYGDEKFMQQVDQTMKNTIELENQIMAMAREEKKKDAVQLIEMTAKYRDGLVNDLAPVVRVYHQELRAGNITRALELERRSKEIAYSLIPITEEIDALLQNVSDENGAIVVSSFEEAFGDANAVQGLSLTITLVALIVGLLLSVFLTRIFRNPILALVGDANQMAAGD